MNKNKPSAKKQARTLPTAETTILVIDDDAAIGEIICTMLLDGSPYRPLWIGESDLALFVASRVKPSVIILDYALPGLDGIQLFDCLQEQEHLRTVPVILISAQAQLPLYQIQQRGMHLLHKPFDLDELLALVQSLVPPPESAKQHGTPTAEQKRPPSRNDRGGQEAPLRSTDPR